MLSLCRLPGRRNMVVTAVAVSIFLITASAGFAQQDEQAAQLSGRILNSENPLDESQREQVVNFVNYYVGQIRTAEDPADVSDARERLLGTIRNRDLTREHAYEALCEAAAQALQDVTEGNSVHVRINALIIAGELRTAVDEITPLITDSFSHPSSAVRYLAAKTVERLSRGEEDEGPTNDLLAPDDDEAVEDAESELTTSQQNDLLEALSSAMADEQSDTVLEKMYEAVGSLTVPEARQVLLNVLNERTANYTGGIRPSLQTDQSGVQSLQRSLAYDLAQERDVDDELRQLAVIAARLLDVVTRELQDAEVADELQAIALTTVQTADEVFDMALQHFDPTASGGRDLVGPAEEGEFDDLRLNALEWIGSDDSPGLLSESSIAIPQDQIQPEG